VRTSGLLVGRGKALTPAVATASGAGGAVVRRLPHRPRHHASLKDIPCRFLCRRAAPRWSWWVALSASAALALPSIASAADAPKASASAPASPTGTRYKADADMQGVLDALARARRQADRSLDAAEARRQPTPTDAVKEILKQQGKDTAPTALVPGRDEHRPDHSGAAGQLPTRIYTPAGAGPFPIVVYFHGGGWVLADKNVYDGGARGIAKEANAVVVSIDYRLAPEAKFPAQHDDALATYKWRRPNAAVLNGDPKRLALARRERRRQPGPGDRDERYATRACRRRCTCCRSTRSRRPPTCRRRPTRTARRPSR
jgi:hypothetical protein